MESHDQDMDFEDSQFEAQANQIMVNMDLEIPLCTAALATTSNTEDGTITASTSINLEIMPLIFTATASNNDEDENKAASTSSTNVELPLVFTGALSNINQSIVSLKEKREKIKDRVKKISFNRNENQEKRKNGQSYTSQINQKQIPARSIGPPCTSSKCIKCKNSRFCHLFEPKHRQKIFNTFWKLDLKEKVIFVQQMVNTAGSKRRTTYYDSPIKKSKRKLERKYHLKIANEKKQVCLLMFINTLGVKERTIRKWTNHINTPVIHESPVKRLILDTKIQLNAYLKKFVDDLPVMESHYCRSSSNKLYLHSDIRSVSQLYT
jgi:hypothetical protein